MAGRRLQVSSVADGAIVIELGDSLLRCGEVVNRSWVPAVGSAEVHPVRLKKSTGIVAQRLVRRSTCPLPSCPDVDNKRYGEPFLVSVLLEVD